MHLHRPCHAKPFAGWVTQLGSDRFAQRLDFQHIIADWWELLNLTASTICCDSCRVRSPNGPGPEIAHRLEQAGQGHAHLHGCYVRSPALTDLLLLAPWICKFCHNPSCFLYIRLNPWYIGLPSSLSCYSLDELVRVHPAKHKFGWYAVLWEDTRCCRVMY